MKTVCTTGPIEKNVGLDKTLYLIGKSGYDAIDFSLNAMAAGAHPACGERYLQYAEHVRRLCDAYGLEIAQAHAPFAFRWKDEEEVRTKAVPRTIRALEVAACAGAPLIVVHPLHHLDYRRHGEALYRQSLDFYRLLLPYAKRFGIKIALEDMFQMNDAGHPEPDVFADADEFKSALQALEDDAFCACVDVGHCSLAGYRPGDMIRTLGTQYVQAVHLHDNDHLADRHTIPYLGILEWDDICSALAEIDFTAPLCMEVQGGYYARFKDEELLGNAIRFANDVGKHLGKKIEVLKAAKRKETEQ